MEKSHGRCDEHYPVIMKGTLLYCQALQTDRQAGKQAGRQAGRDLAAGRHCPFMRLRALISLSEEQDK